MFLHAENAAGLECFEDRRQRFVRIAAIHPIVQIAECQHEIGRPGRRDVEVAAPERRLLHGTEPILVRGESRTQALILSVFLAIAARRQGDGVVAMQGEIGTQNVGPVTSARPQFDHRLGWGNPEESQLFDGMAGRVPSNRGGAACGICNRACQRRISGCRRPSGGRSGEREQRCGERCAEISAVHGVTLLDALIETQYHKFHGAATGRRRSRQFGGASPLNGMGVAPVTAPMVALSLT